MKPGKVHTAVMTWQGTYVNGVMTGMMGVITAVVPQTIRRVLQLAATSVSCVVVLGTAIIPVQFVQLIASTTVLATGATGASTPGFVVRLE